MSQEKIVCICQHGGYDHCPHCHGSGATIPHDDDYRPIRNKLNSCHPANSVQKTRFITECRKDQYFIEHLPQFRLTQKVLSQITSDYNRRISRWNKEYQKIDNEANKLKVEKHVGWFAEQFD
ncbi:MAG: hypothetical protein EOO01_39965, partial [Chitinophagaceae bacterium]